MASLRSILCLVTVFCCLFEGSFSFNPKHLNLSLSATHWSSAGATWYGSPDGFGSDGGSCGYGDVVSQAPFSSMVTSVGPSLYKSGKECGACYQVFCDRSTKCYVYNVINKAEEPKKEEILKENEFMSCKERNQKICQKSSVNFDRRF